MTAAAYRAANATYDNGAGRMLEIDFRLAGTVMIETRSPAA